MMLLINFAQAFQDLDTLFLRRFVHHDRLEPSCKRCVLLHMLAVFIDRRGADHLDLAPGKHGLHDIRSVKRAFRSSGTDDCMELIDKQKNIRRACCLAENTLDALLKFSPVLGSGYHGGHIQCDDPLVLKRLRNTSADDPLRKPFDDGSLADARLSYQAGIILGPSAQNLADTFGFGISADDRIDLPLFYRIGHIPGKLIQHRGRTGAAASRSLHDHLQIFRELFI